jgi:predicted GNAT family acetyltransferase
MPVTQTGLTLREVIDPEGTLPQVTFSPEPWERLRETAAPGATRYVVDSDGRTVGFAEIRENDPDTAAIDEVRIDDEHRIPGAKKGFGVAIYLAVLEKAHEQGKTFRTSGRTLTSDAVVMWNRFINTGIPEVVEPFILTQEREPKYSDIYKGHVIIRPPKN